MRVKLVLAALDGDRIVTVRFNRRVAVNEWVPDKFSLATIDGRTVEIAAVDANQPRKGYSTTFTLTTGAPLDYLLEQYQVGTEGLEAVPVRIGGILYDPDRFHDRDALLGAVYSPAATRFGVFAPTATAVKVVVADGLEGQSGLVEHDMTRTAKGVWTTTAAGDLAGKHYAYKLAGIGFDPDREITDVYATCVQGRHARSTIVDLRGTDPPGFRDHEYQWTGAPTDAIVYEMHVRDFTIAANSGVEHKGKYLGLTEAGTHLADDPSIRTGLDHLVELGVTHVQLMPIHSFDNEREDPDAYSWGYMPVHYNSPEGWYATSRTGLVGIREFKQAVQAFHERGIGVIMDVVYNHTSPRAGFDRLVPGYYYRRTRTGKLSNGSGCGNDFQSEAPMARRFILDSVEFWATEYRVDGFRFDLMAIVDLETLRQVKIAVDRVRRGMLLYGEPWSAAKTELSPMADHKHVRGTGFGAFNDHFRDAIKGQRDGGPPGFIQVGDERDGIVQGLEGAINDWATAPTDTVNYFECHDNLTAWDKLLQSVPDASDEIRRQMMRFAAVMLLTSQGMTFLHSGQEFCRSKQGESNSYNLPHEVNRIDWELKRTNADVYVYHRGLIALRKAHAALRLRTREQVESRVSFPEAPNDQCVVYRIDGSGLVDEPAETIIVLLNGDRETTEFELSDGEWSILVDADQAGLHPLGHTTGAVTLPAHSGMVLVQWPRGTV